MSGVEISRFSRLRTVNRGKLAVTEHPDVILIDLEMPVDAFDAKPIEFDNLVATIRRVLAKPK